MILQQKTLTKPTMSNTNIRDITSFCHTLFNGRLRKTQRENLGRAVGALVEGRDAHLSAVARIFPGSQKFRYRLKRFDRFIGNSRVKVWQCFESLVPIILKLAGRMSGYLVILIDHTDVGKNLRVFYAAVLFKRRALPLMFFVFEKDKIKRSQSKIEESLLLSLSQIISPRYKVVIVADRGFGRVSLFRFLEALEWRFVIRVKGKVWVRCDAASALLKDLPDVWWREKVRYHKTAQYELNVLSITAGTDDPWYLATNLTDSVLVKNIYEKRMKIEELFRDQKWHVNMVTPTTRTLERFTRLLFIVLLASLILLLLGKEALRYPTLVHSLITNVASAGLLWLAGQVLHYGSPPRVHILLKRVISTLLHAL
jgi:hypothetical protein